MIEENEEKVLEQRMYFFVPYNISEIQKGIQAGHAALRFARMYSTENPEVWDFVDNHETWIILNGGTTNADRDFDEIPAGTMNQIADGLEKNDIMFSYFIEPDLNNALSALCFIIDERVFNYDDYPNFVKYLSNNHFDEFDAAVQKSEHIMEHEEFVTEFPEFYKEWVRFIGGVKNVFLRELLKGKKLA